ncbi:GTPase [Sphaerisporangium aureirubrum]|uniref:GTPase n=1 Tax=Sphaerisporangium aureirubrum TaxID=1544736 RepID=A0ABW1NS69_9ACTN
MTSTAKKAGRVDEHAARPDDAAVEGVVPETPEEQTMTFQAIADSEPGVEAHAATTTEAEPDSQPVAEGDGTTGTAPPASEPSRTGPESLADAPDGTTGRGGTPAGDPAAPEAEAGSTEPSPVDGPDGAATAVPADDEPGPAAAGDEPAYPGDATDMTDMESHVPEGEAASPTPKGDAGSSAPDSKAESPGPDGEAGSPGPDGEAGSPGPDGGAGSSDLNIGMASSGSNDETGPSELNIGMASSSAHDETGPSGPQGADGSPAPEGEDESPAPEGDAGSPAPEGQGEAPAPEGDDGGLFQPAERVREVPLPKPVSRALTAALAGLKNSVTGLRLGLDVPGVAEARKAQTEILAQLEDYVIPRVHMSTAPALIAVVGSTGAGKSTLVNTLAAAKVSLTGVRRPTTGTPVLVCHPDDRDWFAKGDVLGGLVRVDRPGGDGTLDTIVLTASERLPNGVALLDTPDIDSVVERHHETARRMLDAADLWIFVTTASRYADAPAWELLRLAKERGARLAIVLSRVPEKSRDVIDKHFARMLQEYGLGDVERFVVEESTVTAGRLADADVADLRMWLTDLSVDEQRREQAVRATLDGVLNSFRARVPALARHLEAQVAFRAQLRTDVDAAYMGALAWIDEATGDGSLLRGEVLARWQDFAGSGDLMKTIHLRRPGRLASKAGQQAPARLRAFKSALRAGLESVIVTAAQRAAEEVVNRWRQREGAGDRLAATPGLARPSDELVRRAGRMVGAWQEHVVAQIRSGGVAKRSVAKVVAFDEEALSLVFMVGLLGYGNSDVAANSGTTTLPERLLRGVLGAEALRSVGTRARTDLRARVSVLFDEETMRYVQVLDEAGIPDEAAAKRLYQAAYNLEVAR